MPGMNWPDTSSRPCRGRTGDRRPLESRFGAWVVCTEQASPFQVTALDQNGTVLSSIEESFPPE
ncbi:MAG TPA: hypothetical protein VMV92_35945 [Streptosporangiaceae bacterium]|nr:hypothetical protein [Streptosporangiaceae bacterium]